MLPAIFLVNIKKLAGGSLPKLPFAAAVRRIAVDTIGTTLAVAQCSLPDTGIRTITDHHGYMQKTYWKSIRRLVTMEPMEMTIKGMMQHEVRKLCLLATLLLLCRDVANRGLCAERDDRQHQRYSR